MQKGSVSRCCKTFNSILLLLILIVNHSCNNCGGSYLEPCPKGDIADDEEKKAIVNRFAGNYSVYSYTINNLNAIDSLSKLGFDQCWEFKDYAFAKEEYNYTYGSGEKPIKINPKKFGIKLINNCPRSTDQPLITYYYYYLGYSIEKNDSLGLTLTLMTPRQSFSKLYLDSYPIFPTKFLYSDSLKSIDETKYTGGTWKYTFSNNQLKLNTTSGSKTYEIILVKK